MDAEVLDEKEKADDDSILDAEDREYLNKAREDRDAQQVQVNAGRPEAGSEIPGDKWDELEAQNTLSPADEK
jgi:hypothetical protein